MAVYTFSTKDVRRPKDTELVERVKEHCERKNINFSQVIVELLREWEKANV